jgi:hypothetical protein
MRKYFVIAIATVIVSPVFAQSTTSTSTTSTSTSKKSKSFKKLNFQLDFEAATKRDGNNNVQGNESYVQIQPNYTINKKTIAYLGTSYNMREAGGTLKGAEKANRDHLGTVFGKFLYKPTRFKDNGIADVRLQVRAYSDQDDFFKRYYGSDGNYQLRAYFGRPIAGNWSFNKYTTYLRYKNYFNNSFVNNYTRDYEMRMRVSPTYRTKGGIDLGLTFTYNHIFKVNKLNDEEEIDIDFGARYQKGPYAILIRAGIPYMTNEGGKNDSIVINEDAGKSIGYAVNLTAFL